MKSFVIQGRDRVKLHNAAKFCYVYLLVNLISIIQCIFI